MCLHERVIVNRSKHYTKGATKHKFNVPCGHCDDCRLKNERDWKLRIWSEIKDYNDAGGRVVFVSFTYDEDHVPLCPIERKVLGEDGEYHMTTTYVRAFNALHKHQYLNNLHSFLYNNYGIVGKASDNHCPADQRERVQSEIYAIMRQISDLRDRIKHIGYKSERSLPLRQQRDELKALLKTYPPHNKKGMLLWSTSKPFRYMWCSEFATSDKPYVDDWGVMRNPTHRPHYHCLFFIPKEYFDLKEFSTLEELKHILGLYWTHGMILWSDEKKNKPNPIFVQSEFAAMYVAKYCFKDMNFYNQPELVDYLYDVDSDGRKHRNDAHFEKVKDYLPKHWQSLSFGLGLCDYFDSLEALDDGVDFHFKSEVEKGKSIKHHAPQYILRKLLYDQLPDGRYVLNAKGQDWLVKLFPNKKDRFVENLCFAVSYSGIEKCVTDEEVRLLGTDAKNRLDLYYDLQERLKNISLETVALYNMVWRGLFIEKPLGVRSYPKDFSYLDSLSEEEFYNVSLEQYHLNITSFLNPDRYDDDGYFVNLKPIDIQRFRYYSGCKRFDGAEYILKITQGLRSIYLEKQHNETMRKRDEHHKFNSFIA